MGVSVSSALCSPSLQARSSVLMSSSARSRGRVVLCIACGLDYTPARPSNYRPLRDSFPAHSAPTYVAGLNDRTMEVGPILRKANDGFPRRRLSIETTRAYYKTEGTKPMKTIASQTNSNPHQPLGKFVDSMMKRIGLAVAIVFGYESPSGPLGSRRYYRLVRVRLGRRCVGRSQERFPEVRKSS